MAKRVPAQLVGTGGGAGSPDFSQKTLETVFEASYDGIYITDGDAVTIMINKSYESITGLKREDITSTPIFDEDGRVVLVVTNVRDITELNSLQKELEESWACNLQYYSELEILRRKVGRAPKLVARDPAMQAVLRVADDSAGRGNRLGKAGFGAVHRHQKPPEKGEVH